MKSKTEPPLSALSEIDNRLTCCNFLNIIRENGDSTLCFVQVMSLHEHMRFSRISSYIDSATQARTRKSSK